MARWGSIVVKLEIFSKADGEGEIALRKVSCVSCEQRTGRRGSFHGPTLELASVKLFRVVLFPLEGLPTNPIRGSRGMVADSVRFRMLLAEEACC